MCKISLSRLSFLCVFFLVHTGCMYWIKTPDFAWPVDKPYYLSRKFSIYHEGIDFPKKTGHPVRAIADGKVIYTGQQFSGYGKMVIIEHKYGWSSLYAHLNKISVQQGHNVRQKDKIGEVGSTGESSGAHLHLELMYDKQPINPVRFLSQ